VKRIWAIIGLGILLFGSISPLHAAEVSDDFTYGKWRALESQSAARDARAEGLTNGYLAGVRDALRFYSRVSKTFPICWPKDHDIDADLLRNIVNAVGKENPDLANENDNLAYLIVLSLYNVYPCR
jgi:hypothetical protein